MPQLMQLKNGQFLLTIPGNIIKLLQAKKGDQMDFNVNLKKGVVEIVKM